LAQYRASADTTYDAKEGWIEVVHTVPAAKRRLLMVQLVEKAAAVATVRATKDIANAYGVTQEIDKVDRAAVQTEGVNFQKAWELPDVAHEAIQCNDIWKVLETYGVEAARRSIVSEIQGVFGVYGIDVNPRHLSLIADFMTRTGSYLAMNRQGMHTCSSPFLQMSFETTTTFLTKAAQEGATDPQESPSARIVLGSAPRVGTGCFDLMLPLTRKKQ
jgi:DNA-directed RNA polymerase I subunit RPA1